MRTGLAKQFKQVLDAQVKRAKGVDRTTPGDASQTEREGGRPSSRRPKS